MPWETEVSDFSPARAGGLKSLTQKKDSRFIARDTNMSRAILLKSIFNQTKTAQRLYLLPRPDFILQLTEPGLIEGCFGMNFIWSRSSERGLAIFQGGIFSSVIPFR